ncbi:hypothetical protein [Dapis sp. BLCC M229]
MIHYPYNYATGELNASHLNEAIAVLKNPVGFTVNDTNISLV